MDPSNPLINITLSMFEPERNCTAAGAFAAHFRRSLGDEDSLPVRMLREFILSCSNTTIGNFTDGNAVDWYRYTDSISSGAFNNFTANIQNKTSLCWRNFCENIDFAGNADLAGIGMYLTYILQAILVTVFVLIYGIQDLKTILRKFRRHSADEQNPSELHTYWKALDSSLKVVWSSSFYFGSATVVASVIYTRIGHGSPGYAYTIQISFYAMLFCAEVVQILGSYRFRLPYAQSRQDDTSFAWLLYFMMVAAFARIYFAFRLDDYQDLESPCLPGEVFEIGWNLGVQLLVFPGLLTMSPMVIATFWALVTRKRLRRHRETELGLQKIKRWSYYWPICRLIFVVPRLVGVWVFVATLTRVRLSLIQFAGDSFPDNAWGFGQIAAVVGWLPMFVEFFRAWELKRRVVVPAASFTMDILGDVAISILFSRQTTPNQNQNVKSLELTSEAEAESETTSSGAVAKYRRISNSRTWPF